MKLGRRLPVMVAVYFTTCAAGEQPPCDVDQWRGDIEKAADRFHVDEELIRAVVRVESGGCEHLGGRPISSASGAMGLMQLMPSTWAVYRARLRLGADPYNPRDNILAGSAYLYDLIQKLGFFDGLAAYFAGAETILHTQTDHTRVSHATLRYVRDVLEIIISDTATQSSSARRTTPSSVPVFAIRRSKEPHNESLLESTASALFAIRRAQIVRPGPAPDATGPAP
jgi:hypothetical protein